MQTQTYAPNHLPLFQNRLLAAWREWDVVWRCSTRFCPSGHCIPADGVMAAVGQEVTLGTLSASLRCDACGERPVDLGLRKRAPGGVVWQMVHGAPFW